MPRSRQPRVGATHYSCPHARTPRSPHQREDQPRLGVPTGLRAQVRLGIRLARSTPGLSVYLSGGLAVWLLTRAMVGHGLASSQGGALTVGALRLLGLALVTVLYFRRGGQLAQALDNLHGLRLLLAKRQP